MQSSMARPFTTCGNGLAHTQTFRVCATGSACRSAIRSILPAAPSPRILRFSNVSTINFPLRSPRWLWMRTRRNHSDSTREVANGAFAEEFGTYAHGQVDIHTDAVCESGGGQQGSRTPPISTLASEAYIKRDDSCPAHEP